MSADLNAHMSWPYALPGSSVRVLTLVPEGDLDDLDDDQDHGDRQVAAQGGEPELTASGHDRLGQHVERWHPPGVAVTAVHVDRAVRPAGPGQHEGARGHGHQEIGRAHG